MDKKPGLAKYYLIFGLLFIFAAAMVVFTISRGADAKADKATSAKASEIANKLNTYIDSNGQIPATLDDTGVNSTPSAITYNKINQSSYKLCVSYKAAAAGFNGGWTVLVTGVFSALSRSPTATTNSNFLDNYNLAYNYKKGQNCQIVSPLGLNASGSISASTQNLISAKCGKAGASFELKDQATVKSIDSGQGILTLETINAQLTDKNAKPVSSLSLIKFDTLTTVYKAGCIAGSVGDLSTLKAGTTITVYLYAHDSTFADQIEL